jgi:hypothetical protein
MKVELDFKDWEFGGDKLLNLPKEVYSLWYKIYTTRGVEDYHTEFQKALSGEYLDNSSQFTRQSCKELSVKLVHRLHSCYYGKGIEQILK